MPHPLLPATLPSVILAKLAGRSVRAVFKAKADGRLSSFTLADAEAWLGREVHPNEYLRACRATDGIRAARAARQRRS